MSRSDIRLEPKSLSKSGIILGFKPEPGKQWRDQFRDNIDKTLRFIDFGETAQITEIYPTEMVIRGMGKDEFVRGNLQEVFEDIAAKTNASFRS